MEVHAGPRDRVHNSKRVAGTGHARLPSAEPSANYRSRKVEFEESHIARIDRNETFQNADPPSQTPGYVTQFRHKSDFGFFACLSCWMINDDCFHYEMVDIGPRSSP